MQVNALLLLYQPRALYKNRKFFLRQGSNVLGSGIGCQLRLADSSLPERCLDIRIVNNLLSVVRLSQHCKIEVQSNLSKGVRCELRPNVEYVLPQGKEFFVGQWRALFEAQSAADLDRLKNVENRQQFAMECMNDTEKDESEENQKTMLVPDCNDGPTQIIPEFYEDDGPTQLIPDRSKMEEDLLPTLILPDQTEQDNMCTQKIEEEEPFPIIQKLLHNQSAPAIESSMPATLQQNSMPATLQDSSMPATLEDNDGNYTAMATHVVTEDPKKSMPPIVEQSNRMLRTMPITNSSTYPQQRQPQARKHQSQIPKKKNLDDLFDDFGESAENNDKNNSVSMSMAQNDSNVILKRKVLIPEKVVHSSPPQQNSMSTLVLEKKQSSNGPNPNPSNKEKRIAFSGFQPSEIQKIIINKMNLISSANDEYDTLIVGDDVKITHRLLKALILGKEILSQTYINNGSGRILTKVFGQIWEEVYKRPRKSILEGLRIYISDAIRQYRELVELVGGTIAPTLEKKLSKVTLKVVLSTSDREIFDKYSGYKNWKFYSQRAFQQALVLAQPLDKPDLSADYFN